jgi:hypothetical protein
LSPFWGGFDETKEEAKDLHLEYEFDDLRLLADFQADHAANPTMLANLEAMIDHRLLDVEDGPLVITNQERQPRILFLKFEEGADDSLVARLKQSQPELPKNCVFQLPQHPDGQRVSRVWAHDLDPGLWFDDKKFKDKLWQKELICLLGLEPCKSLVE